MTYGARTIALPALLAALALVLLAGSAAAAGPAAIAPAGVSPLSIKGSGFKPRERVRVTVQMADGTVHTRRVRAKDGRFRVTFKRLHACDGAQADAVGRRGSRATFSYATARCPER